MFGWGDRAYSNLSFWREETVKKLILWFHRRAFWCSGGDSGVEIVNEIEIPELLEENC